MTPENTFHCTAFAGPTRIASGTLEGVALAIKAIPDRDQPASILVFDDATGRAIDLDLRGSEADVRARLADRAVGRAAAASESVPRGPGRPKLGVVAREVTLLPRHWQWLGTQPGGASVALRKLVEEARRTSGPRDRVRQAQEAADRFMATMVGNEPGYEEAARALFAGDRARFDASAAPWPPDLRVHVAKLAEGAFPPL